MARTAKTVEARERARAARLKIDAARAKRDEKVESAAADYFTASDEVEELLAQLAGVEQRRALAVVALLDLGESQARVAELLDIEPREVRRLRAESAASGESDPNAPALDGGPAEPVGDNGGAVAPSPEADGVRPEDYSAA